MICDIHYKLLEVFYSEFSKKKKIIAVLLANIQIKGA